MRLDARFLVGLLLALCGAGVVAANLPGHLTVDSIMALHEGHFHVRESWNPAIYAWLLGVLDAITPGTALHVVLMGLMLFGSWIWLSRLAPRVSWLAIPAVVAAVATPNILIYQGIVWKDVLFADSAVLGFTALAAAAASADRGGRPWLSLGLAALAFAVGALVRQNGVILLGPAILTLAWTMRARGLRSVGLWTIGWTAATAALTLLLALTCLPQGPGRDTATSKGMRILQTYDLAGALVVDPTLPLPAIQAAEPEAAQALRQFAPRAFSADRVDYLDDDPAFTQHLRRLRSETIQSDWVSLITRHPGVYLKARISIFRWVFGTPVIDRCLPVSVGADGIKSQMAELAMPQRYDERDRKLYNYATYWFDSPAMSHVFWAIVSAVSAIVLLIRRRPADVAIAGLQVGALGFAASFFVVSLACDYRYLYALDVAAITGMLWLAMTAAPRSRRGAG